MEEALDSKSINGKDRVPCNNKAVAPTDEIYPMHTEHPDMFKELDIGEYADRIKRLDNYGILEV